VTKRTGWVLVAVLAVALMVALLWRQQMWGVRPAPKPPGGEVVQPPPVTPPPVTPPPAPAEPKCKAGQAADYFPYHLGTAATYAGKGNEYATYSVKVIGEAGGKVEWRKDNGGTVMAEVFQVAPQQVTLIYREGEAYDNTLRMNQPANQSQPILKGPVAVGTTWTTGNTTYTITSVDASVQALNQQTLTCAVVVDAQSPNSLIRTYLHKQYGIVLSIFGLFANFSAGT